MPKKPDSRKNKRPSMYDVAHLAGVSQTTVSFIVNDAPHANIPQETKDRVWAAIRELQWRPNALARSLTSQRTDTIGFISDEIATTPFASKMILGAQEAAWDNKKLLLVVNTGRDPEIARTAVDILLERQVEGIIYAAMYHQPVTPPPSINQAAVVLLDCYREDRSLPSVVPDECQIGRRATELLLLKGHRRIGFINEIVPMPAAIGRLAGHKMALGAAGLEFDPALYCVCVTGPAEGYRCAMELMSLPQRPTALFCFSDLVAFGAYSALAKLGLDVPDDVAVIGVDNMDVIAANLNPGLSTMELPHYQMGAWAVHYLLDHPQPQTGTIAVQQTIPSPFIERMSI